MARPFKLCWAKYSRAGPYVPLTAVKKKKKKGFTAAAFLLQPTPGFELNISALSSSVSLASSWLIWTFHQHHPGRYELRVNSGQRFFDFLSQRKTSPSSGEGHVITLCKRGLRSYDMWAATFMNDYRLATFWIREPKEG